MNWTHFTTRCYFPQLPK